MPEPIPQDAEHAVLSKKEKSEARKQQNAKWKHGIRLLSNASTVDVTINDPNPRHSLYYSAQLAPLFANACNNDPQLQKQAWEQFQRTLAMPMPVTFRAGGTCPAVVEQAMQRAMSPQGLFYSMKGRYVEAHGKVLRDNIVRHVNWLNSSNSSAHTVVYQAAVDASTLAHATGLAPLSAYLRREVALGNAIRQELASMIPGCLLDLQAHHSVLDVCAAPGSKTEQLLATMTKLSPNGVPSGMVVANDADQRRIHTLRDRYARACVPHMLIVNSRAEDLQAKIAQTKRRAIREAVKKGAKSSKNAILTPRQVLDSLGAGEFDRIVADVPCSGDGTIRKFPHIWRLFRPRVALELHCIQLQIAIASILMLKPGGRMVYSTCSLNPLEDESVVCALLRYFNVHNKHLEGGGSGSREGVLPSGCLSADSTIGGGVKLYQTQYSEQIWPLKNYSLRLVNAVPALLPHLHAHEGLTHWDCDKHNFVNRAAEEDDAAFNESLARVPPIRSTMLPPSVEEIEQMNLQYCRRIMPQDMDSGGFFVAVLELVELLPPSSATTENFHSKSSSSSSSCGYGDPTQAVLSSSASAAAETSSDKNGLNNKISAIAAVDVMARLGYNPAVMGTDKKSGCGSKKSREDKKFGGSSSGGSSRERDGDGAAADDQDNINLNTYHEFRALSVAEAQDVEQRLHISVAKAGTTAPVLLHETTATTVLPALAMKRPRGKQGFSSSSSSYPHKQQKTMFGSRAQGWAKSEDAAGLEDAEPAERVTQRRSYSLLSQTVQAALAGWAKTKDRSASAGAGRKSNSSSEPRVIHAGVSIADISSSSGSGSSSSGSQEVAVLDSAVLALRPFLREQGAGSVGDSDDGGEERRGIHTIDLCASDFRKFAKIGKLHLRNNAAHAAIKAVTGGPGEKNGMTEKEKKEVQEEEEAEAYRLQAEREEAEEERDNALQDILESALYADEGDEGEEEIEKEQQEEEKVVTLGLRQTLQDWYLQELEAFETSQTASDSEEEEEGDEVNAQRQKQMQKQKQKLQFLYLRLPVSASTGVSGVKSSASGTATAADSAVGSNRRMSKAEKKRVKSGARAPAPATAESLSSTAATTAGDANTSLAISSTSSHAGGCAVLALQYTFIESASGDATPVFSWVSSADACESFAFALM